MSNFLLGLCGLGVLAVIVGFIFRKASPPPRRTVDRPDNSEPLA